MRACDLSRATFAEVRCSTLQDGVAFIGEHGGGEVEKGKWRARRAPSMLLLRVDVDRNGVNDDENLFANEISALWRRVRWTSSGSPRTMAMVCADDDKQARTLTLPGGYRNGTPIQARTPTASATSSTTTTTASDDILWRRFVQELSMSVLSLLTA